MSICRPVTLVGFSLGAQLIFKCLECLAEAEDGGTNKHKLWISFVTMLIFSLNCCCYTSKAGIVERVVLLGAPVSINEQRWEDARNVCHEGILNVVLTFLLDKRYISIAIWLQLVAGRFINAYSTDDWTLGIVFRAR